MKLQFSKKFIEDLNKIGEWAFIEKNMWVGKLVPEIICDNLQKRGINQEDIENAVVLTVKEAKEILQSSYDVLSWSMSTVGPTHRDNALYVQKLLKYKIEQAEKGNEQ